MEPVLDHPKITRRVVAADLDSMSYKYLAAPLIVECLARLEA